MTPRFLQRACAVGVALALSCTLAHAATPTTTPAIPDVATDPAGAWAWALDHIDYANVWPAYGVLEKIGYSNEAAEAEGCRANADALRDAIAQAPVSITLRRAAMLCAEALGDDAAAERALAPLAALSRQALSGVTDNAEGAPIRVLHHNDVYGLVRTMGLEWRYEYYESRHMARTFPFVVAAWDPQKKVERHLRFDWVDTTIRMARSEPGARYPYFRSELADAGVTTNAKGNIPAAVDFLAWREARNIGDPAARAERLRQGTLAGGMDSPRVWLLVCASHPELAHCGEGYVDAVLPMAEAKFALPMTLLAYAYDEGVGVPRDPGASKRLLDAADQRWDRKGASVFYAKLWREAHEDEPMPAPLLARIDAAAAAGNDSAKMLRVAERFLRDNDAVATADEIALLSSKPLNGAGQGLQFLAHDADLHDRADESIAYARRAAAAGDPEAQSAVAWELLYGKNHKPQDDAAAEALLIQSAHGGNNWSARQLALRAMRRDDYKDALDWLRDAVRNDDGDAFLWTAEMLIDEKKGLEGRREEGLALLRDAGQNGYAPANRKLAERLISGKGVAKDPAQARRLLTVDAEKGDVESQSTLGSHLLFGTFGKPDEAQGAQWMERAIAEKNADAIAGYAQWLFWIKKTPEARKHAIALWRTGMEFDEVSDTVANNYAWALCTTEDPAFRDGAAGLEASKKIKDASYGEIDTIAACHAAAGDFAAAKAKQQQVVDEFNELLADLRKRRGDKPASKEDQKSYDAQMKTFADRLALYAAGKDYRSDKQ